VNPLKSHYLEGEDVILTAVKNFGYRFDGWSGGYTGAGNPAIVKMNGNKTITANFVAVPTYTINAQATEGGDVVVTPDHPSNVSGGLYEEGMQATLTATAKPGYLFVGWSGDVGSSANPLKLTVDGAKSVVAEFRPSNGLISVDVTPTGTPGTTNVDDGVYTLTSNGNKFGVAPDSFRYLLRAALKGDATFTARLDSLATDNVEGAVAGIQIRTNLADDSAYAAIFVKNGKLVVQARKGGAYFDTFPQVPVDANGPIWLRVQRTINRDIALSWSSDGVTWNPYYATTFWSWDGANTELTVGLFASAGAAGKSATAQFSNVAWPGMHTLTVNAGAGGTVETPTGLYVAGSQVKVRAVPNAGYAFAGWSGALSGKANPATVTMDGNKTVGASFNLMPAAPELTVSPAAGGTITLDPPGGVYAPNQVVRVTAVPDGENHFIYWSGDVEGSDNPIDIVMDGHKTISAKFAAYKSADIGTTYAGSTVENPNGLALTGSGSILWGENDSFRYAYQDNMNGDTVLVAKVDSFSGTAGNARAGIMVRQSDAVKSDYQGIFVTGDKKIRSQFRNTKWTVAEYTGTDTVTFPVWLKVEKQGTTLRTYSSADGVTWVQRGQQTIAAFTEPYTVGVAVTAGQDSKFATALFGDVQWPEAPPPSYTLQTAATHGAVSASPSGPSYPEGTTVTLSATPEPGYVFTGWSGDLGGTANPTTIVMDGNKSVTANFAVTSVTYTLTTNAEHGTIARHPANGPYPEGTAVILTAHPEEGYAFWGWSGEICASCNPAEVVMSKDQTVTAIFVPIVYDSVDVGTTYAGSTSQAGENVTVEGSGGNIWGQSDSFRYVRQDDLTGDVTIVAQVKGLTVTGAAANSNTKAGLMIRQSDAANSAFQGVFVDGTKRVKSIYRDAANGWAGRNYDGTTVETLPIWLKLEKIGNTVKTYTSADGVVWTERSSRTITFAGPFTVGLAVASGTDGKFAEATFGNVTWPEAP
jgi:uncharacterized repeat protein (TIGR02543 family)